MRAYQEAYPISKYTRADLRYVYQLQLKHPTIVVNLLLKDQEREGILASIIGQEKVDMIKRVIKKANLKPSIATYLAGLKFVDAKTYERESQYIYSKLRYNVKGVREEINEKRVSNAYNKIVKAYKNLIFC